MTRAVPVLLALCSCTCADPIPHLPALPFDHTGAVPVLRLDPTEASWTLPGSSLPADHTIPDRFVLDDWIGADGVPSRFGPQWMARLPFEPDVDTSRFPQLGMSVRLNGEGIAYATGIHRPDDDPRAWRLAEGWLELDVAERPAPGAVVVSLPGLQARFDRLQLGDSGLSPREFTQYELTMESTTRPGVLVPAPGSGTWSVTLPAGAPRFEAWTAMAPVPLGLAASDGASVVLEIDGTEVDRRPVAPADDFEAWRVDLAKWGGQTVKLSLRTEPGDTPDHDYVFVGSPMITAPNTTHAVRRVVVIGIDTLRADHLGMYGYPGPISRELDAHAARSAVFDRAWTPAPRTRPSFRTSTTGRYPLRAVGGTGFGEVFADHGFATAGFVANIHLNPRFGFHRGYDVWNLQVGARADLQVARARRWLRDNADRDTALFLHIMDPHLFYNAPPPWNSLFVRDPDPTLPARFGRWDVLEWLQNGGVSQQRRDHIAALYDGEVAFVSKALGSLFETLDDLGGNALVVVHTDHGEELFDHGGFEHNHTLYDELVRAGLWVSPPGGLAAPVRSDAAVSLADIAPTLYDYAGFDDVPEMDGASLRPLVEGHGSDWPDRALPVGFLMYAQEQWGVVHRGHKYIARSSDGREELYDLAADPHEQADLAASADLAPFRAALVEAHGVDAGPGWRLVLTGRDPTPIEVVLPAPAVHAGVLDPESVSEHRANQVWGEVAAVRAEEVATIALSDDRRTLTVVPAGADGVVMVTFDAEHRVAGEARCGDETRALSGERWVGRHGVLDVAAGFVVWPPVGEAARMAAIEGRLGDVTDEERAVLVELGYLKR